MFEVLGWITFALAVFGAVGVGWGLLAFHSEEHVLTTRRIIHADGVVNKRASDTSLDRITDAVLTEPFLGRLLGYGDLRILTASTAANERLRLLRAADVVQAGAVRGEARAGARTGTPDDAADPDRVHRSRPPRQAPCRRLRHPRPQGPR